jgi:hypothetical protein
VYHNTGQLPSWPRLRLATGNETVQRLRLAGTNGVGKKMPASMPECVGGEIGLGRVLGLQEREPGNT